MKCDSYKASWPSFWLVGIPLIIAACASPDPNYREVAQLAVAGTKTPVLLGDGKGVISTNTIRCVLQVSRAFAGDSAKPWMLWCDGNRRGKDAFRVWVYLPPRQKASGVIRGESILCLGDSMPNYWDKKSPKFDGWYAHGKKPDEYAFILPPGENLADYLPTEKPFYISGTLLDSDILEIVYAVRTSAPDQRLQSVWAGDETHVRVSTGTLRGLWIDFEKVDDSWVETRRMKWQE